QAGTGRGEAVLLLLERLAGWKTDAALATVRGPKPLVFLASREQAAWRKLWADADEALEQVNARITQTTLKAAFSATAQARHHDQKFLAGNTYIIEMHSSEFDPYLKLLDGKGVVVAENDDIAYPDNLNSRVIFSPRQDGPFRVEATSYGGRGRG